MVRKLATALIIVFVSLATLISLATLGLESLGTIRVTSVSSDMMSPAVPKHSLAITLAVPSSQIHNGDVILVRTVTTNNQDVLSRVVKITKNNNSIYQYSLKSDNSIVPDPWEYKIGSQTFKLLVAVPLAGFLISIIQSPVGAVFFLIVILALLFGYLKGLYGSRTAEEKVAQAEERAKRKEYEKTHYGDVEIVSFEDNSPDAWFDSTSRNKMRHGKYLKSIDDVLAVLENEELGTPKRKETERALNLAIVKARQAGEPWKVISKVMGVETRVVRRKFPHKVVNKIKKDIKANG